MQSSTSLQRQSSQLSGEDTKNVAAEKFNSNSGFLPRQIKSIVVDDSRKLQVIKAARLKDAMVSRGLGKNSLRSPVPKPTALRKHDSATYRIKKLNDIM